MGRHGMSEGVEKRQTHGKRSDTQWEFRTFFRHTDTTDTPEQSNKHVFVPLMPLIQYEQVRHRFKSQLGDMRHP